MPEYLFLDLYGTLTINDGEAIRDICSQLSMDMDGELTSIEIERKWAERIWQLVKSSSGTKFKPLRILERDALLGFLPKNFSLNIDKYIDKLEEYWSNPTIEKGIDKLFGNLNLPIAIISNSDTKNAESALHKIGIKPNFLITSESVRSYKPNTYIFREAIRQSGWNKNNIWHIGDSLRGDIEPAAELALTTVYIKRNNKLIDPGEKTSDFTLSTPFQLPTLF